MRYRKSGVNVRVTPSEKRRMERRASRAGLTLSEYLRKRALGYCPRFHPPYEFFSILTYMENLTDLLSGRDPTLAREFRSCAKQIKKIVLWKGEDTNRDDENMAGA